MLKMHIGLLVKWLLKLSALNENRYSITVFCKNDILLKMPLLCTIRKKHNQFSQKKSIYCDEYAVGLRSRGYLVMTNGCFLGIRSESVFSMVWPQVIYLGQWGNRKRVVEELRTEYGVGSDELVLARDAIRVGWLQQSSRIELWVVTQL
jgi:hypothetical protein